MTTTPTSHAAQAGIDLDLDNLEALARAATPGPWSAQAVVGYRGRLFDVRQGVSYGVAGSIHNPANATFIAAANPAVVLDLIALARRAGQPPAPASRSGDTGGEWVSVHDRLPPFDQGERVLVYTDGFDFAGQQFFDVKPDELWETDPDQQTDVSAAASHWMPLPSAPAASKEGDNRE